MAEQKYKIEDAIDHSVGWDWENQHVAQAYDSNIATKKKESIAINDITCPG